MNMSTQLFEVRDIDRQVYEENLRDFLPEKIIDIHTHVWLEKFGAKDSDTPRRIATWPSRVARENPIEDLLETYQLMFPNKQVIPTIFGTIATRENIEAMNSYVSECAAAHNLPSLIFALPQWSSEEFEERVTTGKFLGAKVYLAFADPSILAEEIKIFDFLPHHQLQVLDQHGWIVMLHLPRDGRLKDPVNLAQMLEIEKHYPKVKVIIAHVGRAYCPEDVENAFEVLSETKNMLFDISANTNKDIFAQLIRAVGPKRILFGSDLPILRMRMRRVCEQGNYVNIVPKGLYGDVSGDQHMREVEDKEAEKLTFFMYEEIKAFRQAAQATDLTPGDIQDIFFNNGHRVIESARGKVVTG